MPSFAGSLTVSLVAAAGAGGGVVGAAATGAGAVADYKNNEVIRVYDNNANTKATFTAANKADLGAYTYKALQQGDTVVLHQQELTDLMHRASGTGRELRD